MITVTRSKTAEADRVAAETLATRVREAEAKGQTLDPYTQMLIHKAAWASVTGADAVVVEGD
jgi:hypothetical protein